MSLKISQLPEPIRRLLEKRVKEQYGQNAWERYVKEDRDPNNSISWSDSEDGENYWSEVNGGANMEKNTEYALTIVGPLEYSPLLEN